MTPTPDLAAAEPILAHVTAGVMLLALVVYVLTGGADFGGGVWDILSRGRRRERERATIRDAIGPIWEANHVWLIVILVLAFTGFPPVYAAVLTALHVPVTILLLGIVFRGTAFVFRTYDRPGRASRNWGLVFSVSSLLTPVLLGVTLGTVASGRLEWSDDGVYRSGFFQPWLTPFPWVVGFFTLAIFALLAAVYLAVETSDDPPLRESFRRKAIGSWLAVVVLGVVTWILALRRTGHFGDLLAEGAWSWPARVLTALAAGGALWALLSRRLVLARTLIVLEVALIVAGFGLAMHPYLLPPVLTIESAAAPPITHALLLGGLAAGALILLPSMYYLFRVFKGRRAFALLNDPAPSEPQGSTSPAPDERPPDPPPAPSFRNEPRP